jgi:starvation-inducible DNA-binding protein
MATAQSPLPADARKVAGAALQDALVDLIDLTLQAKQAHWNVVGRNFLSLHGQLDELADLARRHGDAVAERAVAIGVSPDGRATTVAGAVRNSVLDAGPIADDKAVAVMSEILAQTARRFREYVAATGEADPVTQDLLIGITVELEKQHWMFAVQR